MGLKLAVLAYLKRDGMTLMLHKVRGHQQGKWNGLGGKLEPGESSEQALRREVLEESGLSVESARLCGFITFPDFDDVDDWYTFVYTVSEFSGELAASDEGELRWVPDGEVPSLNLWEGDRVFLPWLEQPHFFSAVFRYEQGEFEGREVAFY